MTSQRIQFQDGKDTITVITELQPNGEFSAIDDGTYDGPGSAMGFGLTQLAAIFDLFGKLPRAASEREEYDHQAARFDHARDHAKHGVI